MNTDKIVQELVEAAGQIGITVRKERGGFRGGRCTIGEDNVIILNKRQPPESHLAILAESLRETDIESVFLTPTVRSALEQSWEHVDSVDVEVSDAE